MTTLGQTATPRWSISQVAKTLSNAAFVLSLKGVTM